MLLLRVVVLVAVQFASMRQRRVPLPQRTNFVGNKDQRLLFEWDPHKQQQQEEAAER